VRARGPRAPITPQPSDAAAARATPLLALRRCQTARPVDGFASAAAPAPVSGPPEKSGKSRDAQRHRDLAQPPRRPLSISASGWSGWLYPAARQPQPGAGWSGNSRDIHRKPTKCRGGDALPLGASAHRMIAGRTNLPQSQQLSRRPAAAPPGKEGKSRRQHQRPVTPARVRARSTARAVSSSRCRLRRRRSVRARATADRRPQRSRRV